MNERTGLDWTVARIWRLAQDKLRKIKSEPPCHCLRTQAEKFWFLVCDLNHESMLTNVDHSITQRGSGIVKNSSEKLTTGQNSGGGGEW